MKKQRRPIVVLAGRAVSRGRGWAMAEGLAKRLDRIEAGLQYDGAAVQHFGQNGPPFNDVDRCSGDPAGMATDWLSVSVWVLP